MIERCEENQRCFRKDAKSFTFSLRSWTFPAECLGMLYVAVLFSGWETLNELEWLEKSWEFKTLDDTLLILHWMSPFHCRWCILTWLCLLCTSEVCTMAELGTHLGAFKEGYAWGPKFVIALAEKCLDQWGPWCLGETPWLKASKYELSALALDDLTWATLVEWSKRIENYWSRLSWS